MQRVLLNSVLSAVLFVALVGPVAAQEMGGEVMWFNVTLSGANETPNAGDPDGSGTATLTLNPAEGTICVESWFADIALPVTGAHIHEAPAGTAGGIVVAFIGGGGSVAPADAESISGCAEVSADRIASIGQNPANFYLNFHNGEFGSGAIRGQLE